MPTTDLPLKGAIQQPQDMQQQSMAPAVQQQYPQELGTNPMVRQAYDLTQEASQRVRQNMQQSNDAGGTQQLIDNTLNYMYSQAPSKDQFEQDFQSARKAHADYGQLVQKAQQLAAQPHTGQRMALALSALIPGVLGKAARAYTGAGANKTQTELGRALQDIQNAKLKVTDSDAVAKRDWDLYNDIVKSGSQASKAKQAAITSGSKVAAEAAGIGAHYLGLAKAPGEMAHTAQQIETSKSQQKLNDYNRLHGGPEAKIESEKLGNQLKQKELLVKEKELGKPEPLDETAKHEMSFYQGQMTHYSTLGDTAAKSFDKQISDLEMPIKRGLVKDPARIQAVNGMIDDLKAQKETAINDAHAKTEAAHQKLLQLGHKKTTHTAENPAEPSSPEDHKSPSNQLESFATQARDEKLPMEQRIAAAKRYKELKQVADKGK